MQTKTLQLRLII